MIVDACGRWVVLKEFAVADVVLDLYVGMAIKVVMEVSYREHAIPAVVVAMRQGVQLSYNESSTLAEIEHVQHIDTDPSLSGCPIHCSKGYNTWCGSKEMWNMMDTLFG